MKLKKTSLALTLVTLIPFSSLAGPVIQRVSVDTVVGPNPNPNGESLQGAVSADGRYVAFESSAFDLVTGDTNNARDIFRFDRLTNTTIRVSISSAGAQSNGNSNFADMSDDGRYIVFSSFATNLTGDTDNNGTFDIFMRDTLTNTTTLISKAGGTSAGNAANGLSTKPVLSADGKYIAYESKATDILASDSDAISDIYRYNIQADSTQLVSVNSSGVKGNALSEEAYISDNGNLVAFSSDASNLGGTNDNVTDVFVRNINTGTTTAITSGAPNITGFTDSQQPVVSNDGNIVAFESFRSDLVPGDTNGVQDLFVYEVSTKKYTRVSVSSAGAQGDARSGHPGISSDGRFVIFESEASNLTTGDTNSALDVFVYDRTLRTTSRVSVDVAGNGGTDFSQKPRISSNGRYIIFSSKNPLVTTDTQSPQLEDVYLADRAKGNDFDFTGTADVVLRNNSNGQNWMYLMNGNKISTSKEINKVTDLNWKIVGIGDFDGNGKSDLLWRHSVTGQNWMYLMNGTQISTSSLVNIVKDQNWQVVGVGDLNGDGKDDIVWRNVVNGINWAYLMNGKAITTSAKINTAPVLDWQVKGIADFNRDGKDDILWRNDVTGLNWLYLMNGTAIASSVKINGVPNPDWKIEGAADFNRDGNADIIWRNSTTGSNWLYLMNGNSITTSTPVNTVASQAWKIDQVADFDNDGRADIFWRNHSTGENWIYFMNGATILSSKFVNKVTNFSWQIIDK